MRGRILSLRAVAVAAFAALAFAPACDRHKPVPIVDAEPPPPPPSDTVTNIAPVTDDDAGQDAGQVAGHHPGVFVDPKVARIKQCCNGLRAQAKALGSSPEAGLVTGAAAQCDTIAVQAGAKGTAPELAFLRTLRTVPPLCQGL